MNLLQFNLGQRQSSLENSSSSKIKKAKTININCGSNNKIFHFRQPIIELQQNIGNLVSFPQNTNENKKKRNHRNFIKAVSTKLDQMGQDINEEFHILTRSSSADVQKNEQIIVERGKQHIDGDELIMQEIKIRATNISNAIAKIRANNNANNFNRREKMQSLKQKMSERIKRGKETTRLTLKTMKMPTISGNVVSKHRRPKYINSTVTISSESDNNDDDDSSLSSKEEETVVLDTSIDFLSDASYGIDMLKKKSNKHSEDDKTNVGHRPFHITEEEEELI